MPNLRVDLIDPLASPELTSWLQQAEGTTIFHSTNWSRVLAESYGYLPVFFMLSEGGSFKACLPVMEVLSAITGKRGVCVSFSDYCGALTANGDDFNLIFQHLVEYGRVRGWQYIEFRGESHLDREIPCSVYAHHLIELSADEAVMLSRLRKSTARNIQKAVKEEVKVEIGKELQGVLEFYRLHCLTRRRQGLPPQPKSYFLKLHEHLIAQGLGFTALARQGGVTVAALICCHFGRNAIYKYGASDVNQQHLRANNLLFWETIKKCGRDGLRYLSLGRTDLENEGLLVFKDGWGGERSRLNYYRYDLTKGAFVTKQRELRGYRKIFCKMPVRILRVLGALAYRHLG